MYLGNKTRGLNPASKARLNHSHKLENIEPRKRSPDESSQGGPPSPSEVLVFNNTGHSASGGRNQPVRRNEPEVPHVPQADEIRRFFQESWERRMQEIKSQNLTVLWLKSDGSELRYRGHPGNPIPAPNPKIIDTTNPTKGKTASSAPPQPK